MYKDIYFYLLLLTFDDSSSGFAAQVLPEAGLLPREGVGADVAHAGAPQPDGALKIELSRL